MKFTFAVLSFGALVAVTLAAPSDLGRQVGESVSKANELLEKVRSGEHPERKELLDWNVYGSNEAQAQLRLVEANSTDSEMREYYKDSVKNILGKMENERKVFNGVFNEESSDSTEKTLLKAAKSMLDDAEKDQSLTGRQQATVSSLKDQIDLVEKQNSGHPLKDRVLLFQKMQELNEITQVY